MMIVCKFCQMPEGAPGRSGKAIHINRDKLCGPCATLLDKIKYQPEKVPADVMEQFQANCEWNYIHDLFVPVAQRRELRSKQAWSCKICGQTDTLYRDDHYKCYCTACASDVRHGRDLSKGGNRKVRSDKFGTHNSPRGYGAH